MSVLSFAFAIAFALQLPSVEVRWIGTAGHEAVQISMMGDDAFANECIGSGLELRYRFEVQFCERARFWFDDCSEDYRRVHSLQYNPITETYRVMTDRLDDDLPPLISNLEDAASAFAALSQVPQLPLKDLKSSFDPAENQSRNFLRVRVLTQCKSDNSRTLDRLSYVFSLGLVRTSGFDSGWITFPLNDRAQE